MNYLQSKILMSERFVHMDNRLQSNVIYWQIRTDGCWSFDRLEKTLFVHARSKNLLSLPTLDSNPPLASRTIYMACI